MYTYVYIYIYIYIHTYLSLSLYIYRERDQLRNLGIPFTQALVLPSLSGNCSPAPDSVL